MNDNKKNVLCVFGDLPDEHKKYFLEGLECNEISVSYENVQDYSNIDLICTFSSLDNYIRCITNQKSLYISKPAKKGIRVEAILYDKDCIWCTGYGIYANSLIKVDKASMNIEMYPMPYTTIETDRLYTKIVKVENCIYLIPGNSKYIGIFNTIEAKWEKIDIEDEKKEGWYYSEAVAVDGYVYFMPDKAKNIIKIDCSNYKKEILPIFMSKDIVLYNEKYEFCGTGATLVIDKNIYFYSRTYNCFMKFDTRKQCIETVRKLDDKDFSIACVASDNVFWMFTMSGDNKIVKYDIKKDEMLYFKKIPQIEYNRVPFYKGKKIRNKIVFVPGLAEKAIIFDTVTCEINVLEELNIESYETNKENWIYSCIDNDDESIYLFETIVYKFVKYNIENNSIDKKELFVSEKEWYIGQARKVIQMVLQDIDPPNISVEKILEEY